MWNIFSGDVLFMATTLELKHNGSLIAVGNETRKKTSEDKQNCSRENVENQMISLTSSFQLKIFYFFVEPTIMDVMNTPSCKQPVSSPGYWRTPGQIASLTTDFTFVSLMRIVFVSPSTGSIFCT